MTSTAPMIGGWPSQAGKRAGWCGPETERSEGDYTARVFSPHSSWGLGLDGLGAAGPDLKQTKSADALRRARRP